MLQDRLGLSERRARRYVGQPRSTQRREPVVAQDDAALRAELRAFSRERPRWGYRQAHERLLEQGWSINRKRTQRLWREEGLRVPQKRRKRQRRGDSTISGDRLRAERPNHVWAFDFVRHEALWIRMEVRDHHRLAVATPDAGHNDPNHQFHAATTAAGRTERTG